MTCNQLGGACEKEFRAETFEEMAKMSKQHGMEFSNSIWSKTHVRWFIVSDKLRGKGAGNFLMQQAMDFCEQNKYSSVYLWTFQGLGSARHLYEKFGFTLTQEKTGKQ